MSRKYSFPKEKIKVLLLEGVHPVSAEVFLDAGYAAEIRSDALTEPELLEIIPDVHILGIRSKTRVTEKILRASPHLLAIGTFCIGTDQVDLAAAARLGTPVFNAPFSNTRSVAELTVAEIVMLARKAAHRSMQLHGGLWEKSAKGCHEVRHKTLGIVGYGHVGPQVGILAEAFGMNVMFFDILRKLPLGNAQPAPSLDRLLATSDFVTLHVPETPLTRGMIGAEQLARMKRGSYLLNLSRGAVVDLPALKDALDCGQLAGAALDVYPDEPVASGSWTIGALAGAENLILTPHVGGSTVEAQSGIGREVSEALIGFTDTGNTCGAVNFPEVEMTAVRGSHRVLNVHRNVPGVLRDINRIVADMGANVVAQTLATRDEIGYLVMDVDPSLSKQVKREIDSLKTNVRTRLLF